MAGTERALRALVIWTGGWVVPFAGCGAGIGGDPDAGIEADAARHSEPDAASRDGDRHVPRVPDGLVDVFEAGDGSRCEGVNLVAAVLSSSTRPNGVWAGRARRRMRRLRGQRRRARAGA